MTLILFDPLFGRDNGVRSFNFIPFVTIFNYVKAIFTQSMNVSAILTNLLGNLVAFMPLALFLPMLFVMEVELLQLALAVGYCDIDDLLLNVFGAGLAYWGLKIRPVSKLINAIIVVEK